ncbi:MAG: Hsp20/alpha crystallin family protein [Glycocaulis sp.]
MKTVASPRRTRARRELWRWPEDIETMRDDVEHWMSERMRAFPGLSDGSAFMAEMDMSETNGEIELAFDVPGFRKEDLELDIESDRVSVRGQRHSEKEKKGRNFLRLERVNGEMERSVRLPCEIDPEKSEAQLSDGVLTITLKKAVKSAPAHRVEIK